MLCRGRAAARSLDYVWISDEALTEAFNRFARVSDTHRRHGSSVPGPLEARRRQAKRRMGLATQEVSGGNGLFDLAAVFGVGTTRPTEIEKHVRWEAPRLPTYSVPAPAALKSPDPRSQWRRQTLDIADGVFWGAQERWTDPVASSQAAFGALLDSLKHFAVVGTPEMARAIDFLQSAEDEVDARNTLALVQWLSGRIVALDALQAVAQLILEKTQLDTISAYELIEIIPMILQLDRVGTTTKPLAAVLDALPWRSVKRIAHFSTRELLVKPYGQDVVARWLGVLSASTHSLHTGSDVHGRPRYWHCTSEMWKLVYRQLARHFRPSTFAEHFARLPASDLARVLGRHWTTSLIKKVSETPTDLQENHGQSKLVQRHLAGQAVVGAKQLMEEYETLSQLQPPQSQHDRGPLVALIALLSRHGLGYPGLIHEIFEILKIGVSPSRVLATFKALRRHVIEINTVIPEALAADLVSYFMYERSGRRGLYVAHKIFMAAPNLPLSQCYDLPIQLIQSGIVRGRVIFSMLIRRPPRDVVPIARRSTPTLTLKPDHVDLLHLIAWEFANSPHIPSRVAFRRVWECYRFLRDRDAPIGKLLSRALVKAGILRYVKDETLVPKTQMAYILQIVEKIEGRGVANEIDAFMLRVGQGSGSKRHQRWQRKRDLQDRESQANVRYRLYTWAHREARPRFRKRISPSGDETATDAASWLKATGVGSDMEVVAQASNVLENR